MAQPPRDRKTDGSLLATLVVLFLGFIAVLFALALGSKDFLRDGLIASAVFVVIVLIVTGLQSVLAAPVTDYAAWIFREKRDRSLGDFEARRRKPGPSQFGTNRPATADDVRKIREQANVWTPADKAKKKKARNDRPKS